MILIDRIRDAFTKVKGEMNDHLDAINENTNEINSNHEYIQFLEKKIHKLSERLEQLELKLSDNRMKTEEFKGITLSPREQEVFLLLYSRSGDLLDYREISRTLGYTQQLTQKYIHSIISKGIPIIKKYFEGNVFLTLDADFRNLQAKENVIRIQ